MRQNEVCKPCLFSLMFLTSLNEGRKEVRKLQSGSSKFASFRKSCIRAFLLLKDKNSLLFQEYIRLFLYCENFTVLISEAKTTSVHNLVLRSPSVKRF